jgi:uncharacterized protein GlcG (DUF336 family)
MIMVRFFLPSRQRVHVGGAVWFAAIALSFSLALPSCDSVDLAPPPVSTCTELLTQSEVESIIAHAVEHAQRLNQKIIIAVSDREGNVLGVFRMTGARLASAPLTVSGTIVQVTTVDTCIRRARTAAFLSSNQHAFSTVTACFITRPHFPPGVANTAAGPLFGVGLSSLPGSDMMPNGNALNDDPGGIPIFKNGCLAGGIGVIGAASQFNPALCTGQSLDETIALGALVDYAVPPGKRGDNIFIDGIRFLYANTFAPEGNFTLSFTNALTFGAVVRLTIGTPSQKFPSAEGFVNLDPQHNFNPIPGSILTQADVQGIIQQAAAQAARTRAAIRRPVGVAAQVFISVVDVDGKVLGIWRTPDATIFSYDVSAQKARTALAFSDPNNVEFGRRIRSILGIAPNAEISMTTRAVGFLAQDFYPPGIDRDSLGQPVGPGPLFEGTNFKYQFRLLGETNLPAYGNGITIFPGGIPLYKNGQLAGAIGISGDGVDQDDLIASAGALGFEPPAHIRCDQFFYNGVRLPYIKTPRQPGIR